MGSPASTLGHIPPHNSDRDQHTTLSQVITELLAIDIGDGSYK